MRIKMVLMMTEENCNRCSLFDSKLMVFYLKQTVISNGKDSLSSHVSDRYYKKLECLMIDILEGNLHSSTIVAVAVAVYGALYLVVLYHGKGKEWLIIMMMIDVEIRSFDSLLWECCNNWVFSLRIVPFFSSLPDWFWAVVAESSHTSHCSLCLQSQTLQESHIVSLNQCTIACNHSFALLFHVRLFGRSINQLSDIIRCWCQCIQLNGL